ncbi:MAG: hypothetical protein ACLR7D_12750 [Lachnospira eligens]
MLITFINIRGAKTAAILQTVLTAIIAIAGILLVVGSAVNGDAVLIIQDKCGNQAQVLLLAACSR